MSQKENTLVHVVGSLARTLLGLTFLFSGFVKAVDPLGTTYKIEDYLKAFGGFFTELLPLAETAAILLIAVEFVLGFCLLINVKTSWTAWLTLVFYLVMTPLTYYIARTNPVSDCGCFGDALVLTNWQTFAKNIVLLVLSIVLLACKKHIRATFVWQAELGLASLALIGVSVLMGWTLMHLPLMDFRPYKVGNYLPDLMEIPDGAPLDQYEVTFVYSKDGKEQTFTLDNYPKGDSSWVFVRQNARLVQKGYEPPVHDLEILTSEYEDITYDILESESEVTLAILYDLTQTNVSQLDKLIALYRRCVSKGQAFYLLTGSGTDAILSFCLTNGMDELQETICTCDPVTLKTIVRANPGVVVMKNGKIIDKYNIRDYEN